ncbi:MAG: MotA/TolQ/ExbB proton channel family protein, partial [Alphaproteobacteria bacterium]|nr:MotA/TolQ/ExbB proton channel family protein [Alphaproteobacteria bacterium]
MGSAIKNTIALVVSVVVVHLFYVGYVWPEAASTIEAARA